VAEQASEDISKYLFQMKVLLYGDGGASSSHALPSAAQDADQDFGSCRERPSTRNHRSTRPRSLCKRSAWSPRSAYLAVRVRGTLLCPLYPSFDVLLTHQTKQARKDVSQIFNNLLRRQIGSRWPTVEHLSAKEDTIFAALKGFVSSSSLFPIDQN
jgi:hypothetical protein